MQRDKHRDSTAGHLGPWLPSKPNVLQPLHPSATAEAPGQASALLVQLPVCPVQALGHDWEETKIPTGQFVPPPAAAHLCFKDAMSCLTWCPQSGTTRPYGYPTSSLLTLLHGINTPSHILILTRDEPSALPTWPWGHLTSRTVPTAMSSSPQGHLGGTVPSLNATPHSQRRSVPSSGKCPTGCVTDIPGIETFLPGTKGFGPPTQDQCPLAHPTGHPHGPVLVLPCRGLWCATAPRDLLSHSNGTQHGQGSFPGPRGPPGVAVLT